MRNVMCIALLALLLSAAGGLYADTAPAPTAAQADKTAPVLPSVLSYSFSGGAAIGISPSFDWPRYAEFINFGLTLPGILPRSERFAFSVEGAAVISAMQSKTPVNSTGGHGVSVAGGMLGAGATWYAVPWFTLSADALFGYYGTTTGGLVHTYSGLSLAATAEADFNFLLFNFPLYVGLSASVLNLVGFSDSPMILVGGLVLGSRAIFGPRPVLDADPSQPAPVKDWILPLQKAEAAADAKPAPAQTQPAPQVAPEKPQLLQTPSKDEPPPATAAASKQAPSAAGVSQKPAAPSGNGLAIQDFSVDGIFPIFHTYYDDHPIGRLTLTNTEYSPLTNVTVSFVIRQYMDAPKECVTLAELKPGEQKKVDIYALFKNTLLDITQATKVAGEIMVSYSLNGKAATLSKVETVRIYDRNAMTWDDDRKAAAFVTPKEPAVLIFSNNINALLKGKMSRAVDKNLQIAMALHDALRLYGISYVSNPLTPYAVTSRDKSVVDTLKFPRQTFDYRSGDCSDLSILYSALMESVQIETAFITIPGHIFMALALQATPDEIRRSFTQTDELIFRNDKVWVPVEVTERDKSFMGAWQEGAKEWRDNLSKGQAGFYPVHEAWSIYEPVGLPGSGTAPALPDAAQLVKDFRGDVTALVDREIFTKVAELQAAIGKSQESPKSVNVLGVLYARYDLLEKAEREFKKAIAKAEFSPALLNLGNLSYRNGDMDAALAFYTRANKKDPKNPLALLGIARASHEIENYATVRKAFAELKVLDPDLASRFAYLELKGEEATRAAEISEVKELVIWQE